MSNTYALNVTRGKEFEVEAELRAMGVNPWVARRLDSKYVKEKRGKGKPEASAFVWYDAPYIPKLVFAVFPAVYWRDVLDLKHVIGKPIPFSDRDIKGKPACAITRQDGTVANIPAVHGLDDFKTAVLAEYSDMDKRRVNSEYQCIYAIGQALDILSGPFVGLPAQFKATVKNAYDDYAKLKLTVDVMGRSTTLEVTPDMVRSH